MIVIEDDGPGIPDAEIERVFQPFVRLEESRGRETGGSGLGLTIARAVIRSHGGEIVLANRPEGGLRVTIRLPKLAPSSDHWRTRWVRPSSSCHIHHRGALLSDLPNWRPR